MELTQKTTHAVCALAISLVGGCFSCRTDESTPSTEAPTHPPAEEDIAAAVPAPEAAGPAGPAAPGAQAKGTAAPESTPAPRGFRDQVLAEMGAALGGTPHTNQDAINATYQHIGWRPGAAPTEKQNRQAYHQAMAWGTSLARLNGAGREAPFHPEDLEDGPVDESVRFAKSSDPAPRSTRAHNDPVASIGELTTAVPAEPTPAETDEEAARRAATLARLSSKVDALGSETSVLDHQVSTFEQDVRHASSSAEARSLTARKDHLVVRAEEVEGHAEALGSEVARAHD